MKVLIGVTGSVAAIKVPYLIESIKQFAEVKVVATKAGLYFLKQQDNLKNIVIHQDQDEWPEKYKIGDEILHIELRRWSDCFLIAPLDANTLGKITHGLCDNLLTSVVRAWDWKNPLLLCPSMNTMMWENPPTADQLEIMRNRGAKIIPPVCKKLACGDEGIGAMASIKTITDIVFSNKRD